MSDLIHFYMATAILLFREIQYSLYVLSQKECSCPWRHQCLLSSVLGTPEEWANNTRDLYVPSDRDYQLMPLLTIIVAFINNSVILSSMRNLIVNSDYTWHQHLKFYACTSNYMLHCYSITGLNKSSMLVTVKNRNFVIVLDVFQTT